MPSYMKDSNSKAAAPANNYSDALKSGMSATTSSAFSLPMQILMPYTAATIASSQQQDQQQLQSNAMKLYQASPLVMANTTMAAVTPDTCRAVGLSTNKNSRAASTPTSQQHNKWTPEEDTMLRSAVEAHGAKNWKQISTLLPLRSDVQCLHRWQKVLKPGLIKGSWTKAEDDTVRSLVEQYGIKRWSFIAKHLPGRSRIQCRERWYYHLSPDIKKTEWTEEEDIVIVDLHQKLGNRWALMAKELPGRTNNAIYNRWNYTLKRVLRQGNGSLAKFHKISGIKRKLAVAQQVAASVTVPPAPSGPTAPAQRPPAPGYHGDTSPTASCERYDGHVSPAASNRRSAPSAPGPLYNYRNGERRALVMSCQSESIPNGTNSVSPNSGRKKSKKRHFDCEGF